MLLLLCTILIGLAGPAFAQKPAPPPPGLSPEQARAALEVLNDPAKRAAFAATLAAIAKAQPAAAAQPAPAQGAGAAKAPPATTSVEGVKIPLAPDSLGAQVLLSASAMVNNVGNEAMRAMDAVQSLPLLYGWAVVMMTNPIARGLLIDAAWRVAVVLLCAVITQWALRRALRRPIMAVEALAPDHRHAAKEAEAAPNAVATPEGAANGGAANANRGTAYEDEASGDDDSEDDSCEDDTCEKRPEDDIARAEAGEVEPRMRHRHRPSAWLLLRRLPLVLARLGLELVPVVGLVLVGHLLTASDIGGQAADRLIILAVIDAYAACAALLCVARMLLSPTASRLRLFHLRDSAAVYMMKWSRRLILVIVFGYAIGEVGLLLGLSTIAHNALQKFVGLIVHACLIVIVLRNKSAVRRWLRAPEGADDFPSRLRNGFARVWHWVALFFLVAGWLVWAVEVPHGYTAMLDYFVLTALILIGARLTLLLLLGVVDRAMRPPADSMPEGIRARLRAYHPVVATSIRLFVYFLSTLGLLQVYGLNTLLWLVQSQLGQRLLSALGSLALTIIFAFGVWELVNGGFQQHLDRLQREAQLARSARLRTLLPLLRTTLLITIAVVAILMTLSEIGINVGPLLAGAGIVGVAIGFGSQKLVQDLITGIFLLLENAMQVGDWVTVSGLSGTVENLSVRTIRLRAGDGSVHIIPFSSVTSVTNVNRGLGNAAVSVTIEYQEDVDHAFSELKAVIGDMRKDPDLSAKMLSDFQLFGVDKVDGASVTITGQVVCTDSGRWPVQREINRRIKQRFQAAGIKIYDPTRTILIETRLPLREAPSDADQVPSGQTGANQTGSNQTGANQLPSPASAARTVA